jgi:hypothetical protein
MKFGNPLASGSTSAAIPLGTGIDGTVVISSNTTLTRDMNYTSLTVNSGVTLKSARYKIYCTGIVTVNGTIDDSGIAGILAASGVNAGLPTNSLYGSGYGGYNSTGGSPPAAGNPQGGQGGAGFFAGGTVIPGGTLSLSGLLSSPPCGGAGGGGDGGDSPYTPYSAAATGGGVVQIFCNAISGNGTLSANGGTPPTPSNFGPGIACGGAGGGIVAVCTHANNFTGTILAQGTAGQTNVGGNQGGASGTPGANGQTAILVS